MAGSDRNPEAFRRYSALVYAGLTLLILQLPSRLNVPRSDPSAVAEYAPVPGGSQGSSDVSELGAASGDGLGSRAVSTRTAGDVPRAQPSPGQPRPGTTLRCIGSPPRQTEDPLSPPCVPSFRGDNGGATDRGVTKDEVVVIVFVTAGPGNTVYDYGKPPQSGEVEQDAVFRAFQSFFNSRYQTYDRFVHFYGLHGGGSTDPPTLRSWVQGVDERYHPFAFLVPSSDLQFTIIDEAAQLGMIAVSFESFDRAMHQKYQPRFITFSPDRQDVAALVASYVCRKLNGRTARHSGNTLDVGRTRTFGVLSGNTLFKRLLREELGPGCGVVPLEAGGTEDNVASAVAKLRTQNVTTVILAAQNGNHQLWANAAMAQGWFPEWFITGDTYTIKADQARVYPQSEWRHAFGITYSYRRDAIGQQPWYAAFQEGCGGCPAPSSSQFAISQIYDSLGMLFFGIQAAGPRLTVANLDRGLHSIPQQTSANAYRPSAYFAPGNWSYVKDAMSMWWDIEGPQPGVSQPGCFRLPDDGRRFRAGEWTQTDTDLFAGTPPCQGPDAP